MKGPRPVFVNSNHSQVFQYQGLFRLLTVTEDVKELVMSSDTYHIRNEHLEI